MNRMRLSRSYLMPGAVFVIGFALVCSGIAFAFPSTVWTVTSGEKCAMSSGVNCGGAGCAAATGSCVVWSVNIGGFTVTQTAPYVAVLTQLNSLPECVTSLPHRCATYDIEPPVPCKTTTWHVIPGCWWPNNCPYSCVYAVPCYTTI